MMIHDLKIKPNYLKNLLAGIKRSEVRLNDRDYQKGDCLRFFDAANDNREHLFEITHIHSGLGLADGYVVLSVVILGDSDED